MQPSDLTYEEDRRLARIRQQLARDKATTKTVDLGQQSHGTGQGSDKSIPYPIREQNRKNRPVQKGGPGVSIPVPISERSPDGFVPILDGPTVCRKHQRPPLPVVRAGRMVAWAWVNDPVRGWHIVQDAPADRRFDPVTAYARERTKRAQSEAKQARGTVARDAYRRRSERRQALRSMVGQSA